MKAVAPDADREECAGLPALVDSLAGNPQNPGDFGRGYRAAFGLQQLPARVNSPQTSVARK